MLKLMSGVGGLGNPQAFIAAVVLCEHAATLAKAKAEVDTKLHVATSPVFQTSTPIAHPRAQRFRFSPR